MPCTVSRRTGALHRLLAVVGGVAAKRTLINRAIGVAVEWHTHVLEVVHHLGCFTTHELNGVLVTQPIRALDRVVEVVVPVVLGHVTQRGTNAALRGNGV